MIPRQKIDEIFQTAQIEEVIGDFVHLKKSGSNYKALSPFSDEKTPSFMVSPSKQIFKDFSSGKGGNAVNFLMEHEQMTYPEALRYLAQKYNIEIEEEEQTDEQKEEQNRRESLQIVNSFAEEWFMHQLHETDEGKSVGLNYFKEERGLSDETIKKFKLGYCPDQWGAFTEAALAKGYKLEFLEETGLTKTKNDKHFDFFRGRVLFPIHDLTGRPVGFGGRTLKTDKKSPKYFNSPESPVYNKSRILYGMDLAKKSIVNEDECFLVEGYTDVTSLHQAGIENVVAASGTSLTKEQIRIIRRYTPNITLLFDGDPAGIRASLRGVDLILEEGMNVNLVSFPEGEDPDSYARSVSTEELKTFLKENAQDLIVFKANLLAADAGKDPVKRSELIREIVGSIALIPDHILRQEYIRKCSLIMEVDEQPLINEINKMRRKQWEERKKGKEREQAREEREMAPEEEYMAEQPPLKKESDLEAQERNLVRLLLNYQDETISIDSHNPGEGEDSSKVEVIVGQFILEELVRDGLKFQHQAYNKILKAYLEAFENDWPLPDPSNFTNHEEPEVSKMASELGIPKYELSERWKDKMIYPKTEKTVLDTLVPNTVADFKLRTISQMEGKEREKLKEVGSDVPTELLAHMKRLIDAKKTFSKKLGRVVVK